MVQEFIQQYFCDSITQYQGYNPINTLVYAAILLAVAFGLILPWLKRLSLPLDHRFLGAVIPFILFGSSFRILEDLKLLGRSCNPVDPTFYTLTPGIYILVGVITIAALFVSTKIFNQNHSRALQLFQAIGWILALPLLAFVLLRFQVWDGVAAILVLAVLTSVIAWLFTQAIPRFKPILQNRLNQLVFVGQMLDANATFVAIQFYTCSEQHVLSAGIINLFSPFAFVVIKFALMLAVLYYADKEIENENTRNFIKIVIAILGFAPGIRDTLTLGVGTCL